MQPNFPPIQNYILSKLKNAKALRYSELQPEKTPNDLFNYHLQQLVKKSFVIKSEEGYSLSDVGVKYVADPFPTNDSITSLFKINVITIVSRKNGNTIEILNQVRTSNPSYGKVGVMGGVVRKGEMIEVAATRKLEEETGLIAQFRLVGNERRIMYKNGELFSDVLFPIAYATEYTGELKALTEYGENKWVSIEEAIQNESAEFDSIQSIKTTLEAIRGNTIETMPMFFNETIQSDSIQE